MSLPDLVKGAILARIYKCVAITRFYPNMNEITENIWVGGFNHPDMITSRRFNAVLDLRERDYPKYMKNLEDRGIEYISIKIPDGCGTSPDILTKIAEKLDSLTKEKKKVLVHCNLGRGRAALATASYFVYQGASPEKAIKIIKKKRGVTYLNEKQRQALKDFSENIHHLKLKSGNKT